MKGIVVICTGSFTGIMLLFSLLCQYDMAPQVTEETTIQVFLMALSVAVVMFLAEKIEEKFENISLWTDVLIRIFICYAVVFLEGILFGMFDLSWSSFREITPILIPVFLITYGIGYLSCQNYAESINKSIRQKSKKEV